MRDNIVKIWYFEYLGDVDASAEDVGGDHDPAAALVELWELGDALVLLHASVDGDGGNGLLVQILAEEVGTFSLLHEYYHLIKLELVDQLQ